MCNDSHLCESDNGVCVTDPECIGYDVTCNVAHDNCFFCGDDSDCASSNGCCQGHMIELSILCNHNVQYSVK